MLNYNLYKQEIKSFEEEILINPEDEKLRLKYAYFIKNRC